jgi:hypothetical protein
MTDHLAMDLGTHNGVRLAVVPLSGGIERAAQSLSL